MSSTTSKGSTSGRGLSRRRLLQTAAAGAGAVVVPQFFPGLRLSKPAWAADGVVKMGASLPLTGTYEKVSKIYRDAYEFWTETLGGKLQVAGQELPVEWTIYDDENQAPRTAQLTEKLINDDKVDLIVGTYGTDTVLAQGAIAKKYGRITVQAGAASSRVDDEIGGTATFTIVGSSKVYPATAMDYLAAREPKPKRVGIIIMDDAVYQEMAQGVREKCAEHGMEVVFEEVLPSKGDIDLRPTALKLKNAGDIDILYNTGWDLICIKLVQEMKALDVNVKALVGGHLTTNPVVKETLGKDLDGVYGVTLWLPTLAWKDPHFASPMDFSDKFKAAKGYAPTYHAAMAYTACVAYESVLKDASGENPFDADAMRAALFALKTETVFGPLAFNEKGRNSGAGAPALQWQGSDPSYVVLAPEAVKTGEGVYPVPAWKDRA